ncbi:MAG TPA: RNA polymerase sigma factor [Myxococcota bacterium]|nr:RNA polymerase sigma factor [Myxococcota bacterium]
MSTRLSDEDLLAGIRVRDSGALRALFQRYRARVFYFAQRRLHDEGLAEEVVADVFFEVWRSAHHYQGASRLSTWIFGIAHFKCAGAHRDRSRHKRASVVPMHAEALHRVADESDAGERLAARQELRLARQALERLPADQREAIELAVLEGLPYEEIAERLGVPEGTVKTRVARARARLRRGMRSLTREDSGHEPPSRTHLPGGDPRLDRMVSGRGTFRCSARRRRGARGEL